MSSENIIQITSVALAKASFIDNKSPLVNLRFLDDVEVVVIENVDPSVTGLNFSSEFDKYRISSAGNSIKFTVEAKATRPEAGASSKSRSTGCKHREYEV